MTATQPQVPTITRSGSKPATPRKLFVNLPVSDLQRSIRFFEGLGFTFNPHFTDAGGTCMLVGEDAYFMLASHARFTEFSRRPVPDAHAQTGAIYCFALGSRAEVDAMVKQALASGGTEADPPQDHGFMYDWAFFDPDGHVFQVFWMDPSAIPAD